MVFPVLESSLKFYRIFDSISMKPFEKYLVGVVRVPAANLIFPPVQGSTNGATARLEKASDITRLVQIFRDTGFDPSRTTNQIFGIIQPRDLKKLQQSAQVSAESLLESAMTGRIPLIVGDYEVLCLEGRRRVEAAKMLLARDAWWTIRLHSAPDGKHYNSYPVMGLVHLT